VITDEGVYQTELERRHEERRLRSKTRSRPCLPPAMGSVTGLKSGSRPGRTRPGGLDRLEAEHDNLAAAICWHLDQDQPGPALQLSAMTWQYWWLRGHTEESARYGEVIVASGEKPPAGQLGYAQIGLGLLLILSGDKARAQMLFQQALALFRRLENKRGIAIATGYLGHLAALRGDYGKASKLLTESLASPQELGDDVSIALMYNFLGQIPLRRGDNDAAARLFSQALDAARRVPDRFPLLISLYDLARSSQAREDLVGAAGFLREGLSVTSGAGDESSVGYYLQRLTALAMQREDPDRAVRP
jgi:tetratricopeptide (TPR) repeat protein